MIYTPYELISFRVNIKKSSLVSMRSCIELRNLVSQSSPCLTIHTTIDTNNTNNTIDTIHTIHTIDTIDVDNTIVDTIGVIV